MDGVNGGGGGLTMFRRPASPPECDISKFMDKKTVIEYDKLSDAMLYGLLEELTKAYIMVNNVNFDEIRARAYANHGLRMDIVPTFNVIHKQYRLNVMQGLRIYGAFMTRELVGPKTNVTLENSKRFSKVFEAMHIMYELITTEHRIKAINIGKCLDIPEELSLFRFSFQDFSKHNPYQSLIIVMLTECLKQKLRRYGTDCYHQIYTPTGSPTHAWEKRCSIKTFIHQCAPKEVRSDVWLHMTSTPTIVKSVVDYLVECNDLEFIPVVPNRHVFAFNNGIYIAWDKSHDADTWGVFHPYDTQPVSCDVVAAKYFRQDFKIDEYESYADWYDVPTPDFQTIMDSQGWSPEVCRVWYAMLGRCLYDVGNIDEWQIMPFVKGVAGSGKSTMGSVLRHLYAASDVGIMSSNIEKKFGLSQFCNKFAFICFEVKENFGLDQAEMQSLISGEEISMAVKNKDAVVVKWTAPGLLFGNESGGWIDASGSISRRMLMFECNKTVNRIDPKLGRKIGESIAPILYKCNMAYRQLVHDASHTPGSLWNHLETLTPYFKDAQKKMAKNISPLKAFIEEYDGYVRKPTAYIPFDEFWKKHNEFLVSRNQKKISVKEDYWEATFEQLGFIVTRSGETKMWEGNPKVAKWINGIGPRDP